MCVALSQQDPGWYALLTGHLSPEQAVQVQEMLLIADKRTAARGERTPLMISHYIGHSYTTLFYSGHSNFHCGLFAHIICDVHIIYAFFSPY